MIHSCQDLADRQKENRKQNDTLHDGSAVSNTHGMHATSQVLVCTKTALRGEVSLPPHQHSQMQHHMSMQGLHNAMVSNPASVQKPAFLFDLGIGTAGDSTTWKRVNMIAHTC
jgi:hypothetical protein